jgi:hypothetical protein
MGSLFGVYLIMDVGRGTWDVGRGTWDVGRGTWDVGRGTWDVGTEWSAVITDPVNIPGCRSSAAIACPAGSTAFGGRTGIRRGDTGTADGETTMTVADRGYAPFVRSF